MAVIDKSSLQIGIVVDENQCLLGVVTDGDIRRALLKKMSLSASVALIMNKHGHVASVHDKKPEIFRKMQELHVHHMPIVNDDGKIVDLETLDHLIRPERLENTVVLMAGGLGSRLRPLTDDCPKPLLKVGDKSIVEIIIEQLAEQGLLNIFIIINYKGDMIADYLKDGSQFGVNIRYIREEEYLGTAGGLALLPLDEITMPFFVMNADLLTSVNYRRLLEFHMMKKAQATMCIKQYHHEIPYGVVENNESDFMSIHEKPIQTYFVNAGIYVLDPILIQSIPSKQSYDMVHLFKDSSERNHKLCTFPIYEDWKDIGYPADYQQAVHRHKKAIKAS
ncbi:nucleotidyltransferase family protein [Candidiatus Paracoxiella cheracis]|uniref:nucleotidyltransferase family protein n=1 Tax=Candidiatus Paracoxiella cheracis TaxID=3405120 RepID=UPI003BF5D837